MIEVDDLTGRITIIRGDSGFVTVPLVEVIDGEERPYVPQPGEKLRFAAAKKYGATEDECIIIRDIPLTNNRLYFYPEDTKNQKFGKYKYDLEFTDKDGYVDTILRSEFVISEEVY